MQHRPDVTRRRALIVVLALLATVSAAVVTATGGGGPTDVGHRSDSNGSRSTAEGENPIATVELACEGQEHELVLEASDDARPFRPGGSLADGTVVDASDVAWRIPAQRYRADDPDTATHSYAVYLGARSRAAGSDVCMLGGALSDEMSHETTTWSTWHDRDAPLIVTSPRAEIVGTRIFNSADGIRFARSFAEDWTVRGVHIRQVHDDCIENDHLHSGLIEDSFLDGCYTAISARPTPGAVAAGLDGTGRKITIRESLLRLQPMPHVYRPERYASPGHMPFFKFQANWHRTGAGQPHSPVGGRSPQLEIHDSVFVLEQHPMIRTAGPGGPGVSHLDLLPTFDPNLNREGTSPDEPYLRPEDCSDNTLVWLGDGTPDFSYLPPCFTVLTGEEAREFWMERRTEWLEEHPRAWQRERDPEVFAYDELAKGTR